MSCLSCIHCIPASRPAVPPLGSVPPATVPAGSPAVPHPSSSSAARFTASSHARCALNGFTVNARMTCEEYAPRTENPE